MKTYPGFHTIQRRHEADQTTPIGGVVEHAGITCKLVNKGKKHYQLKDLKTGRIYTTIAPR